MKTQHLALTLITILAATLIGSAQEAAPPVLAPTAPRGQVLAQPAVQRPEPPLRGTLRWEEKGASRLLPAAAPRGESSAMSSFDVDRSDGVVPPGMIKFVEADLFQVLDYYQELTGRTVIRSTPLPHVKISVRNATPLSRVETIQLLDTALSQNGIATVLMGAKSVKVVPAAQAHLEAASIIRLAPNRLPESGSYLTYEVKLKKASVVDLLPALQPFAKLPNSIVAVRNANLLILRDYSANVRRMLEVLEKLDR